MRIESAELINQLFRSRQVPYGEIRLAANSNGSRFVADAHGRSQHDGHESIHDRLGEDQIVVPLRAGLERTPSITGPLVDSTAGLVRALFERRPDDDTLRAETAKAWSEKYKTSLEAGDINCDGCTSDSDRLFAHCNVCEIRKCGNAKAVENCAHCEQ